MHSYQVLLFPRQKCEFSLLLFDRKLKKEGAMNVLFILEKALKSNDAKEIQMVDEKH